MARLLTIGLMHGHTAGNIAKVSLSDGRDVVKCYLGTGELMKCLTGQVTQVFDSYEEAIASLKLDGGTGA